MLQIYFLSVLCNIVAGLVLIFCAEGKESRLPDIYKFALGIISALIALLTLVLPSDGIIIAGDIIPAAAALVSGLVLLYEHFQKEPSSEKGTSIVLLLLRVHRRTIGCFSIIAGALHFLLPNVILI